MADQDLTTSTKVKSLLNISVSTWDTLLAALVTSASDFIARYCNRSFNLPSSDETEYYDGSVEKDRIQLKKFPVTVMTSISYASGAYNNPTWTAYDPASQFVVKDTTGEVFFDFCLPRGRKNIKVVYRGGYASNAIPTDLDLAAQKLVAKEFLKRSSQGVLSESVGGANVSWNENLDPTVIDLLSPFKAFHL